MLQKSTGLIIQSNIYNLGLYLSPVRASYRVLSTCPGWRLWLVICRLCFWFVGINHLCSLSIHNYHIDAFLYLALCITLYFIMHTQRYILLALLRICIIFEITKQIDMTCKLVKPLSSGLTICTFYVYSCHLSYVSID